MIIRNNKLMNTVSHSRRALARLVLGLACAGFWADSVKALDTKAVLDVYVSGSLPGFKPDETARYVAGRMSLPKLSRWTFVPGRGAPPSSPNRVEWNFDMPAPAVRGLHPVSAQLKLFLDGHYQTLVFNQASVTGGEKDDDLAELILKMTGSLLGPNGAIQAIGRR